MLGQGALVDLTTLAIALATFGVCWRGWKLPEPSFILGAGAFGLLLAGTRG